MRYFVKKSTVIMLIALFALAALFFAACGDRNEVVDIDVNTPVPEFPEETVSYVIETEPPQGWVMPTMAPEHTLEPGATPAPATPVPTQEVIPDGYMSMWEKTRLVNFKHRLADDFVPHDMVNAMEFFKGVAECKLDTTKIQYEVAVHAKEMFRAAANEGVPHQFRINNAYRTMNLQWQMWNERLAQNPSYGANPYLYPVGTMPGNASEHCAGLALDITCVNYPYTDNGFGNTAEGKWLRENAHRFGFILRYPAEKANITGVHFESWHFRYVGKELSEIIHSKGVCLEEYYGEIPEVTVATPRPVSPVPTAANGTPRPTSAPTQSSTAAPTARPTAVPTPAPTQSSTPAPTSQSSYEPTAAPTAAPVTDTPGPIATETPTGEPSHAPTTAPTAAPTAAPTEKPTEAPTPKPTEAPTPKPTEAPTPKPTAAPTPKPTEAPDPTEGGEP